MSKGKWAYPVVINGRKFKSVNQAAKKIGISHNTILLKLEKMKEEGKSEILTKVMTPEIIRIEIPEGV